MGGKKSKAPPAPDYTAAAKAQGAADLQTAKYTTEANRINQYGPDGSITFSNPSGNVWNQYTRLSPGQQNIYNAEQANELKLQNLGSTAIGQAQNTLAKPFNPNLTAFQTPQAYQGQNFNGQYTGQTFNGQYRPTNIGLTGNTMRQFGNIDEELGRQYSDEAAKAVYDKSTQFLGQQFDQSEQAERNRLQQMGLQEGTEAYQRAIENFQRTKGQTYQTAGLDATLAGYDVGTQQLNNMLGIRGVNVGQAQGQFDQDLARYGVDQSERQAQFANQLAGYGANQAERQAQFSNQLSGYGANQAERQARATSSLNLANQAADQRQQQFAEQSYARSLPINEISALLGGQGVNMPQFQAYSPATAFNAPDLLGAQQAQYNAQMGAYNSQQQGKGSLLGAGASLAGGFLGGK